MVLYRRETKVIKQKFVTQAVVFNQTHVQLGSIFFPNCTKNFVDKQNWAV